MEYFKEKANLETEGGSVYLIHVYIFSVVAKKFKILKIRGIHDFKNLQFYIDSNCIVL